MLASANAHMIMATPPPYGKPNNSPLDPSGSDFPCKSTSSAGAPVTEMAIGTTQQLSFTGQAVHGGGSCQVSLTTDNPATKNSKWMVIHSIEGGCPARGSTGNAGDNLDAAAPAVDQYDYKIPQGIAPGAYTLAWTWFNKVGNREMYMNCASIKVSGGAGKRDVPANETEEYSIPALSERATPDFPEMFRANMGGSCQTAEGDLKFPNPGASLETMPNAKLNPPTGADCGKAGAAAAPGSASPSGGAPASAPSTTPDTKVAASNGSAPAAASAKPPMPATPVAPAAPPAAPAAPAPAGGAATGTCSKAGESICSPDGKQIGTCDASLKVTWIPVASGTKCSGGLMVHARSFRSAKFRLL